MKNQKLPETIKSILNNNWQAKDFDERLYQTIKQRFSFSPTLAKLLAIKEITLEEIEDFLNPSIKNSLPNPFLLKDMDKAVSKIILALKNKQKITIFGDYDVDGATSSALLKRFLDQVSQNSNNCQIYIPDRIEEGYGPNPKALLDLKNSGTNLVITVDCGTTAFKPLEDAYKAGLDVIVIDHHLGALEKPKALAIVNPNRLDEDFEHKNLCGVGVCFLLAVGVNKLLREENYYQKNNISEPQLLSFLDLVALGTICDIVPLDKINRAFVRQGLKVIHNRKNLGIRNLCDISGLNEACNSYHLGFALGPRINAGGRVGKSYLGAKLLSSYDELESREIATQLNIYNQQRKDIEENVLKEAEEQIIKNNIDQYPIIFAHNEGWHPGVIGIVASRIKEKYNKPTAIIALDKEIGKASCRSINDVDFGSAIIEARSKGIIIEGGGHAMAAGFSIAKNNIKNLHEFLCDKLQNDVKNSLENNVKYYYDELDINSSNLKLAYEIRKMEPFGPKNSKPRFLIKDLIIIDANLMGKDKSHIRCIFSSKEITGWQGRLSGVCFKAMENNLGPILLSKNKGKNINIIASLNINHWMGNDNLQIMIEDILPN